jgi:ferritin-like metal-binding protein YciE
LTNCGILQRRESTPKDLAKGASSEELKEAFEEHLAQTWGHLNALRNAFVKAFEGKLENWKQIPKVEPEKKQ